MFNILALQIHLIVLIGDERSHPKHIYEYVQFSIDNLRIENWALLQKMISEVMCVLSKYLLRCYDIDTEEFQDAFAIVFSMFCTYFSG